ncbi:MAG: YraN family protein [Coxiellaceae bacterium]|nr:YraN family protein [Coxiellaceae bacterium]|tara:strand:- start:5055 stop:5417 length:363 start_codon:yes stop_codon:yes gene_type:complete
MPSPRQDQGYYVEQQAKRFLKKKGFIYLSQHFQCRFGEIDLIMKDGDTLVFVEVRSRQLSSYSNALESISLNKQRKLIKAIHVYLHSHQLPHLTDCRIDIVGKDGSNKLYWIQNALEVQY